MRRYSQSPLVSSGPYIPFAFYTEKDCRAAKDMIETSYRDLKTKMVESKTTLSDGYKYVLFVENRRSMNFNLSLASIVGKYGGVPRDNVTI